jgi:hypothetical protein
LAAPGGAHRPLGDHVRLSFRVGTSLESRMLDLRIAAQSG